MSEFPRPIGRDESKTSSARDGALPRAIEFPDIRVGDRVRLTCVSPKGLNEVTVTGPVLVTEDRMLQFVDGAWYDSTDGDWQLLERPRPEFKPGQVWRFPPTEVEYLSYRDVGVADDVGFLALHEECPSAVSDCERRQVRDLLEYVGEAVIGIKDAESRSGAPASPDAPEIRVKRDQEVNAVDFCNRGPCCLGRGHEGACKL